MKVRVRLNCRTRNYTYGTADYGYYPKGGVEVIDALPQVGEVDRYGRKLVGINELRLDPEQPNGDSANYDFYELEYVDIDEIDDNGDFSISDIAVDLVAVEIAEEGELNEDC